MKVMVLCLSRGYGGLELYAAKEVEQLRERGHACLPMVARESMLDKKLREGGIEPDYLAVTNRRLPLLAARKLARVIDAQQVDLIHIHWNNDLNLAALARKFSRCKPRLIYSRHMAITRSKKDPFHRWFYRQLDHFIVVTKCMQQEAKTYLPLPADRISQLYLGVPEVDNQPADYDACFDENFPRRKLNIALFGRIEPYKGQHLLVAATTELVRQGLDISATIIGHVMDQGYFADLQARVTAEGLTKYVKFEAFVNNPVQRMKCYDVVALTTYCETFGLVLIEAMRAGVLVIGTDAGGVKEIIDDEETGLLFSPGDVESLRNKISILYDNPDLIKKISTKGKNKADELFADKKHFDELIKFFGKNRQADNV